MHSTTFKRATLAAAILAVLATYPAHAASFKLKVAIPGIPAYVAPAEVLATHAGCVNPFTDESIAHEGSITGYLAGSVPHGETCQSGSLTCQDGVLTGEMASLTCEVLPPELTSMVLGSASPAVNTMTLVGTEYALSMTSSSWLPDRLAVSSKCHTSGKWYAEMRVDSPGSAASAYIGASTDPSLGSPRDGGIALYSQGGIYATGVALTSTLGFGNGTVIGFLLDMDARQMRFTRNGTALASSSYVFPADSCVYLSMGAHTGWGPLIGRIRTNSADFAYQPPAGYSPF